MPITSWNSLVISSWRLIARSVDAVPGDLHRQVQSSRRGPGDRDLERIRLFIEPSVSITAIRP
jgi:hypothetical protein